jgi:hypothetical protein
MPKTWAKPYRSILDDNLPKWLEATCKTERHFVAKEVAIDINAALERSRDKEEKEEDKAKIKPIDDLENVSVRCRLKRNAWITLFRKL